PATDLMRLGAYPGDDHELLLADEIVPTETHLFQLVVLQGLTALDDLVIDGGTADDIYTVVLDPLVPVPISVATSKIEDHLTIDATRIHGNFAGQSNDVTITDHEFSISAITGLNQDDSFATLRETVHYFNNLSLLTVLLPGQFNDVTLDRQFARGDTDVQANF